MSGGVVNVHHSPGIPGKVVVITGGGSGIGRACAEVLADRGASIAVVDVDAERADEVAALVGGCAYALDVRDLEASRETAALIRRRFGRIDALVTSAGVTHPPGPPRDLPEEQWRRVVGIDQWGSWASSVVFAEHMAETGGGSVVNIASVTGMRSVPMHAYGPAKAAVIAMASNLAVEWAGDGVRVNVVSPGFTLTEAMQALVQSGERDRSRIEAAAAMGRMVLPDEVAKAVCFLISDDASAITGINLPVDCGWLAGPPWETYGVDRPSLRQRTP